VTRLPVSGFGQAANGFAAVFVCSKHPAYGFKVAKPGSQSMHASVSASAGCAAGWQAQKAALNTKNFLVYKRQKEQLLQELLNTVISFAVLVFSTAFTATTTRLSSPGEWVVWIVRAWHSQACGGGLGAHNVRELLEHPGAS
jgi:hypothetical protein